jgi:hypothetical protein
MKRSTRRTAALAVGVLFLLLVGVAVATPPFGIVGAPVHARGSTDGKLNVSSDAGVKLKTRSRVDVVTQQIELGPGGHTGWHSHPGPVLVTVMSGALQLVYADDCTGQGTVYEARDTFVDRGDETVHIARNVTPNNGNVVLWATYFVPGPPLAAGLPLNTGIRTDQPAPGPADCEDEDDDDEDDDLAGTE